VENGEEVSMIEIKDNESVWVKKSLQDTSHGEEWLSRGKPATSKAGNASLVSDPESQTVNPKP
jgi:hypothetical protein